MAEDTARRRGGKATRFAAIAAIGAAELALPAAAGAVSYGWSGNLPNGAGGCWFYSGKGNCGTQRSDWNYNDGVYKSGPFYLNSIHLGFENAGAIRGIYLTQSHASGVFHRSVGFPSGTSLKPELTAISWQSGDSSIHGWYRAHT